MATRLTNLIFAEWVRHVFDHPVSDPAWHFDLEAEYWAAPSALTVAYLTRLFSNPLRAASGYSDAQLNQGLWYIVYSACSSHMLVLHDESVPMPKRVACVRAISTLYRKLFASRCSPHLGHLSEEGANPLNLICYMWWDLIPLSPSPDSRHWAEMDEAVLGVMAQTLTIPSPACQEGALHGLGHWAGGYPARVRSIIDGYLQQRQLRPELHAYAEAARAGCVL